MEHSSRNVVNSPYSAINAIVLFSQADNGNTVHQLKSSINFTGSASDLLDQYVVYQKSLTESAQQTMLVANKLYVQKGYQVNPKFQEIATEKLMSGVEMVDFTKSAETAKIINDFAAEKTHNRTGDIVKPAFWHVNTRIVLMNTVYMKFSFDNVHQAIFVNSSDNFYAPNPNSNSNPNSVVLYDVEYVNIYNAWFNYVNLNDSQAIEIRFADSNLSLVLILPNRQNVFPTLEAKVKDADLTQIIDQMRPEQVTVKIPTFRMEYQTKLRNIASKVGIIRMEQP